MSESARKIKHSYSYLLVLSIFSAACFITTAYLEFSPSDDVLYRGQLPPEGGELGPIHITRDNLVGVIVVRNEPVLSSGYYTYPVSSWSFIEGELLDSEKEFLMGFGDEMWKERDSEGTYDQSEYELSLTFPEQGDYYLNFISEFESAQARADIFVKVTAKNGNSSMHFLMGIVALIGVYLRRSVLDERLKSGDYRRPAQAGQWFKKVSGNQSGSKNPWASSTVILSILMIIAAVLLEIVC